MTPILNIFIVFVAASFVAVVVAIGVSGRAVRRRVLTVDPFARKVKEVPRGFSKDRCKVCDTLLTAPLAMPAEKNVCAMCIREAETAIHHRTATGSYERKQK